jgi:hypothetical protein
MPFLYSHRYLNALNHLLILPLIKNYLVKAEIHPILLVIWVGFLYSLLEKMATFQNKIYLCKYSNILFPTLFHYNLLLMECKKWVVSKFHLSIGEMTDLKMDD